VPARNLLRLKNIEGDVGAAFRPAKRGLPANHEHEEKRGVRTQRGRKKGGVYLTLV